MNVPPGFAGKAVSGAQGPARVWGRSYSGVHKQTESLCPQDVGACLPEWCNFSSGVDYGLMALPALEGLMALPSDQGSPAE